MEEAKTLKKKNAFTSMKKSNFIEHGSNSLSL